jgi:AcrR family transcriptional regulator
MARRSEHSRDEIKAMILEAAENIVREQGFSALKIRKISADIGYTVASVYMIFTNMDDLNTQIKTRTIGKMLDSMTEKKECLTVAMTYYEFVLNQRGLCRMLLQHQALKNLPSEKAYDEAQIELQLCFRQSLNTLNLDQTELEINNASKVLMSAVQGVCLPLLMQKSVDQTEIKNSIELLLMSFLLGWCK